MIGKKDIMNYYKMTNTVLDIFLKLDLPVRYINNRVYAHTDNVDEFLKNLTMPGQSIQVPDLDK